MFWKKFKKIFLVGICCFLLLFLIGETTSYGQTIESGTKSEVLFVEGKKPVLPPTDNKDNNYKPAEPETVKRLLPQTGETILSFMLILIGLSIVLLVVGAVTMKRAIDIYSFY